MPKKQTNKQTNQPTNKTKDENEFESDILLYLQHKYKHFKTKFKKIITIKMREKKKTKQNKTAKQRKSTNQITVAIEQILQVF